MQIKQLSQENEQMKWEMNGMKNGLEMYQQNQMIL